MRTLSAQGSSRRSVVIGAKVLGLAAALLAVGYLVEENFLEVDVGGQIVSVNGACGWLRVCQDRLFFRERCEVSAAAPRNQFALRPYAKPGDCNDEWLPVAAEAWTLFGGTRHRLADRRPRALAARALLDEYNNRRAEPARPSVRREAAGLGGAAQPYAWSEACGGETAWVDAGAYLLLVGAEYDGGTDCLSVDSTGKFSAWRR